MFWYDIRRVFDKLQEEVLCSAQELPAYFPRESFFHRTDYSDEYDTGEILLNIDLIFYVRSYKIIKVITLP